MTWAPVTMRWPSQSTQWMDDLSTAQGLASGELASTALRLASLEGAASTQPGPVGAAAGAVIASGRVALAEQLSAAPSCLVVTPFQSGIGQGRGYQRFLSAPNLLEHMAEQLINAPAAGSLYGLCVLFLSTRLEQLAQSLARFNALLPIAELQRTERRAMHLSRLESEKWHLPTAGSVLHWQALPLERCTVLKAVKQSMSGQLAVLESYAADSAPLGDLAALAQRKAAQQEERDAQLDALKALLAEGASDVGMRARLIGPGNASVLRHELLAGDTPGHEWVLCAGALLLGTRENLSFVQEMLGL